MDNGELLVGTGQARVEHALPADVLGEVPGFAMETDHEISGLP